MRGAAAGVAWLSGSFRGASYVREGSVPGKPRLLDAVREAIRLRHYSRRTEKAYVAWIRRYIVFHAKRHPRDMGAEEVTRFLSSLAIDAKVSASTQNQALAALLFLYGQVLGTDLPWLHEVVRAGRSQRLPVVLSQAEVRAVLLALRGTPRLMGSLLYGAGLRLLECCRLRVKDVDFASNQLIVRSGKGDHDRVTLLPPAVVPAVRRQLAWVQSLHDRDLRAGAGWVELPHALGRKYRTRDGSCRGSGSSRRPERIVSRRRASAVGTTCTRPSCSAPCTTPSVRRVSPSAPAATRSDTPSRLICSRTATTSGPSRSCWDTATSARR